MNSYTYIYSLNTHTYILIAIVKVMNKNSCINKKKNIKNKVSLVFQCVSESMSVFAWVVCMYQHVVILVKVLVTKYKYKCSFLKCQLGGIIKFCLNCYTQLEFYNQPSHFQLISDRWCIKEGYQHKLLTLNCNFTIYNLIFISSR